MTKRHLKQCYKVSLANLHLHAPATVKKIKSFLCDFVPPTLKCLSLSGHSNLLEYISDTPKIFQNVQKQVCISGFNICAESLKLLFENCSHIEELIIKGCTYTVSECVFSLDPTLRYQLKTLNLYWTYRMADSHLKKLDLPMIFNALATTNLKTTLERVIVSRDNWLQKELDFLNTA